jgi:4-diphosphocytidyl-2-C-methyl-D-erythritol kinase
LLLVNPRLPLPTAAVFRAWDGKDRGALGAWRDGRNDLEQPARRLAPEVANVLEALRDAEFSRMSGSGATCFGLYGSEAARDADAASIAAAHPQWWILATRLRAM